jgi:hypothetical protein
MITVVNKRQHVPTDHDVYVGRPTALGNPFPESTHGREQCIAMYKTYAAHQYSTYPEGEFTTTFIALVNRARTEDINLVCWCHPQSCHADVLKQALDRLIN